MIEITIARNNKTFEITANGHSGYAPVEKTLFARELLRLCFLRRMQQYARTVSC